MILVRTTRSLYLRYLAFSFPHTLYFVDAPSASANPQVLERVTPLQAEVGQEFLDKLTSRGQKHKAPEPEAGSSHAPPAKRPKKPSLRHYRKREMPVADG
jgi:hypothetical protein